MLVTSDLCTGIVLHVIIMLCVVIPRVVLVSLCSLVRLLLLLLLLLLPADNNKAPIEYILTRLCFTNVTENFAIQSEQMIQLNPTIACGGGWWLNGDCGGRR